MPAVFLAFDSDMRILISSVAGWGHVHPMVPLAKAFLDRGDEVLWATAPSLCPRVEAAGLQTAPAGIEISDALKHLYQGFPEIGALPPEERPAFAFSRLFGAVLASEMLKDLLPAARDWQPSLTIGDAGELAAPLVAASLGVPHITHGFGAVLPAVRVQRAGEFVDPLWEEMGLEPRPYAGCYDHLYLDIYPPGLSSGSLSHIPHVQSLRPVPFAGETEEGLPFELDPSIPVIYVTFGTVFTQDISLLKAAVDGVGALPVQVVVTVGPAGDPESLDPRPDNVHVARYIPQTALLGRCAAVISHAGSGTFLAALSNGLPQLCLPQAADQFLNAQACAEAGVGLTLMPGSVTAESVREATLRLLNEAKFREAAERCAVEMDRMPGPDEVAEIIAGRFGGEKGELQNPERGIRTETP